MNSKSESAVIPDAATTWRWAALTAALGIAFLAVPQQGRTETLERTGKAVTETVCAGCHDKGANGAPRIGDHKAWAARATLGLTGLTREAIDGMCKLLSHSANAGLTPLEIERAVTYMVNQSGGNWAEPISRTTRVAEYSGQLVVQTQCARCHEKGVGGAPVIGDRLAWIPRAKLGFDTLARSAINGHGGMPARGGAANLTDREINSAIAYMINPAMTVAAAPAVAPAAAPERYNPNRRVVDGMEIYFGATSAAALRKLHAGDDPESRMHHGIPKGDSWYHVNVSVFDAQTKAVISDAWVEAKIADPVRGDQVKSLEPMAFNNTVSYGNYFRLPSRDGSIVAVVVRKPGDWRPTEARFTLAP